jgi:hypothetical protein
MLWLVHQRLVVVEPFKNWRVFILIELNLNRFKRLDIKNVIAIIERRFFIIKRRESIK